MCLFLSALTSEEKGGFRPLRNLINEKLTEQWGAVKEKHGVKGSKITSATDRTAEGKRIRSGRAASNATPAGQLLATSLRYLNHHVLLAACTEACNKFSEGDREQILELMIRKAEAAFLLVLGTYDPARSSFHHAMRDAIRHQLKEVDLEEQRDASLNATIAHSSDGERDIRLSDLIPNPTSSCPAEESEKRIGLAEIHQLIDAHFSPEIGALLKRYMELGSYSAVASEIGKSPDFVRSRVKPALPKLSELMRAKPTDAEEAEPVEPVRNPTPAPKIFATDVPEFAPLVTGYLKQLQECEGFKEDFRGALANAILQNAKVMKLDGSDETKLKARDEAFMQRIEKGDHTLPQAVEMALVRALAVALNLGEQQVTELHNSYRAAREKDTASATAKLRKFDGASGRDPTKRAV